MKRAIQQKPSVSSLWQVTRLQALTYSVWGRSNRDVSLKTRCPEKPFFTAWLRDAHKGSYIFNVSEPEPLCLNEAASHKQATGALYNFSTDFLFGCWTINAACDCWLVCPFWVCSKRSAETTQMPGRSGWRPETVGPHHLVHVGGDTRPGWELCYKHTGSVLGPRSFDGTNWTDLELSLFIVAWAWGSSRTCSLCRCIHVGASDEHRPLQATRDIWVQQPLHIQITEELQVWEGRGFSTSN